MNDQFSVFRPGPSRMLRPALPWMPNAGDTNALVLNHPLMLSPEESRPSAARMGSDVNPWLRLSRERVGVSQNPVRIVRIPPVLQPEIRAPGTPLVAPNRERPRPNGRS